MDGILIINKPGGITSHDCLKKLKYLFNKEKMGHTGTLDPAATGVLVVCIGIARKLIQFMVEHSKEYEGQIVLGISTDSGDSDGQITSVKTGFFISEKKLKECIKSFVGEFNQTPPMVSAVKHRGKPLYVFARKGENVKVPSRKVMVYRFDYHIGQEQYPLSHKSIVNFNIKCSKGTYIRKIAMDMGDKLGCGAHLQSLDRTGVGTFRKEDSYCISEVERAYKEKKLKGILLPVDSGIKDMPAVHIYDSACPPICSGAILYPQGIIRKDNNITEHQKVRIYSQEGQLLSIGQAVRDENRFIFRPIKVLKGR